MLTNEIATAAALARTVLMGVCGSVKDALGQSDPAPSPHHA